MEIKKIVFHYWDRKQGEVVEVVKYNVYYKKAKSEMCDTLKEGIEQVLMWNRYFNGELLVF